MLLLLLLLLLLLMLLLPRTEEREKKDIVSEWIEEECIRHFRSEINKRIPFSIIRPRQDGDDADSNKASLLVIMHIYSMLL